MPDLVYISLAVGALGLILAIAALVAIGRTKREQARPRISSKLAWITVDGLPTGTIRLDIWNAGRNPITIRKIQLLWQDGTDKKSTGSLGFTAFDPYSRSMESASDHSLQPCEGKSFVLPPLPPSMMRTPAELPDDRVWISVQSESCELARFAGSRVRPLLEKCLKAVQTPSDSHNLT